MDDRLKREAAFFNDPKGAYLLHFLDRGSSGFARWLIREVLKSWDKHLGLLDLTWVKDKVVLEACCGNPRILRYFDLMGARKVIGCDIAKEFLASGLASSRTFVYDKEIVCGAPRFSMIIGDVQNLPLAARSIDTVCCFQALHHVDMHRFASECARVLPPGGHVFISDPVGSHPLRGFGDWVGRRLGPMTGDEKSYDPAEVVRVFEKEGFRIVRFVSLNPFSEIYFQVTELFTRVSPSVSFYLKIPMCALNRLEPFIEKTVLRKYPSLGWRFALALEKT